MTKHEELAQKLEAANLQYRQDIPQELVTFAKENDLIIAYGLSDDILQFEGAVREDFGAWRGTLRYLLRAMNGDVLFIPDPRGNDYIDEHVAEQIDCPYVELVWCPEDVDGNPSWLIKTKLPYTQFSIYEDGYLNCAGAVIDISNLPSLGLIYPSNQ